MLITATFCSVTVLLAPPCATLRFMLCKIVNVDIFSVFFQVSPKTFTEKSIFCTSYICIDLKILCGIDSLIYCL